MFIYEKLYFISILLYSENIHNLQGEIIKLTPQHPSCKAYEKLYYKLETFVSVEFHEKNSPLTRGVKEWKR